MPNQTLYKCPSCGKPLAFIGQRNKRDAIVECTTYGCILSGTPATIVNLTVAHTALKKRDNHGTT